MLILYIKLVSSNMGKFRGLPKRMFKSRIEQRTFFVNHLDFPVSIVAPKGILEIIFPFFLSFFLFLSLSLCLSLSLFLFLSFSLCACVCVFRPLFLFFHPFCFSLSLSHSLPISFFRLSVSLSLPLCLLLYFSLLKFNDQENQLSK